jgi:hypothetical protein
MFNSKNSKKYNSKVVTKFAREKFIDPAKSEEYQTMVAREAFNEPKESRLGLIDANDAGNMWDSNIRNWSSGNYPTTEHAPGAATPHADFANRLTELPNLVSQGDVGPDHPAMTGERQVFSGIKNHDSGRHFNIHLFYGDADEKGQRRLKASTHIPGDAATNLHGSHIYDVSSGVWHKENERHTSPNAISGYSPVDVLQAAPADAIDTTRGWTLPPPSEAACNTCHRFPRFLGKMLDLMRPKRCTTCGEVGRAPKYPWEPGSFTGVRSDEPEGRETSAFRQARSLVCDNRECMNFDKPITAEPAFVDRNYDVTYPGPDGPQSRKHYKFTKETKAAAKSKLDTLRAQSDALTKEVAAQRFEGDVTDNAALDAALSDANSTREMISDLEYQLNPKNHKVYEGKIPDEFIKGFKGTGRTPYETIYDNEKINGLMSDKGRKAKRIRLPMPYIFCDHDDCTDVDQPIPTHVDVTPNNTLPCTFCGRDEQSGAKITRSGGFPRCNPAVYGANNCAPIPEGVTDPEAYLSSFKPDPEFKSPTVKPIPEAGVGIVYQSSLDEKNRNSPEGLYPGMPTTSNRTPGGNLEPLDLPDTKKTAPGRESPQRSLVLQHGIERPNTQSSNLDHYTPWTYLGPEGRGFAEPVPVSLEPGEAKTRQQAINRTLGDERVTPEDYQSFVQTPVLGDVSNVQLEDVLPDVTIPVRNKYRADAYKRRNRTRKNQPAVNSKGEEIAPGTGLTQEDWDVARGTGSETVKSVPDVMRILLREQTDPSRSSLFPVKFEKRGYAVIRTASIEDEFNAFDNPKIWLPDRPEEDSLPIVGNLENDTDVPNIEECPACNTFSIINKPGNIPFTKPHCGNCDDATCGTTINDQDEHCRSCKKPEKGCSGRPRSEFYKSKGYKCPVCENNGYIETNRTALPTEDPRFVNTLHCADCDDPNCPSITSKNTIHCNGCPEHAKEQNGEEYDATPGAHVKNLPGDTLIIPERTTNNERILGVSPKSEEALEEEIKRELIPTPEAAEAEGVNPKNVGALEAAQEEYYQQRKENAEEGILLGQLPAEKQLQDLSKAGPVVFLRDYDKDVSKKVRSQAELDVQEMALEPHLPGVSAQFDSPNILSLQQAIREDYPSLKPEEDEIKQENPVDQSEFRAATENAPDTINGVPVPHITHDINCTKCNRGLIDPDKVGPEEMGRINGMINEGTAAIRRNVADPIERRRQISQLQADAYTCRG